MKRLSRRRNERMGGDCDCKDMLAVTQVAQDWWWWWSGWPVSTVSTLSYLHQIQTQHPLSYTQYLAQFSTHVLSIVLLSPYILFWAIHGISGLSSFTTPIGNWPHKQRSATQLKQFNWLKALKSSQLDCNILFLRHELERSNALSILLLPPKLQRRGLVF